MTPDNLLAALRFAHDAALMALWGASAYLWALVPQGLAGRIDGRLNVFRLTAVMLVVVSTIAVLPVETAMIGNGWPDAANGQMLWDVLASTNVGTAWLVQATAVLLLAAAQMLAPRLRLAATAITSAFALSSLALSGHAVMGEGWQGIAHPLNDALHVLSAGAWGGALLPLLFVLSRCGKAPFEAEAATALRRFSTAGHVAVALAILSGIANSIFIVGWPVVGLSSPYRVMLSMKIVVVLAMMMTAIANRYWFVPHLGKDRAAALNAIRAGTVIEIGLALAAILLVSIFGMLDPFGD